MTIGEVRAKLEPNYNKHYENVKTNYYISSTKAIQYIREVTGCDFYTADTIVREWMNSSNDIEYKSPYGSNTVEVKCPYFNSLNTTKISELSKVGRFALWGIFSLSKNSKSQGFPHTLLNALGFITKFVTCFYC